MQAKRAKTHIFTDMHSEIQTQPHIQADKTTNHKIKHDKKSKTHKHSFTYTQQRHTFIQQTHINTNVYEHEHITHLVYAQALNILFIYTNITRSTLTHEKKLKHTHLSKY